MANKSPTFVTPAGVAVYPHLNRPDVKFHDLGIYKADVAVEVEDAKELMNKLMAYYKQTAGQAANKFDNTMFTLQTDEDGEPTGKVVFKLRVKNRMTKKGDLWDRKPKMFDASLTPLTDVNPYGGTVMKVNFEAYAWSTNGKSGVSLQPVAVQIIELQEGDKQGGANAAGFGFEATEGFKAEGTQDFVKDDTVADDSDDDGDF